MSLRPLRCAWLAAACIAPWMQVTQAAVPVPSYTYGELGYVSTDLGDANVDGDGFGIDASYAIHPNAHLVFGYQGLDFSGGADGNLWDVGVGLNFPLHPGMDAVGRVKYVHATVGLPAGGDHEQDGYALEGLVRFMINPQLEFNGGVEYISLASSNTSGKFGAVYSFTHNLALSAELGFSGNGTTFFIGGRLYFDPLILRR
jgi:hypothetical protein